MQVAVAIAHATSWIWERVTLHAELPLAIHEAATLLAAILVHEPHLVDEENAVPTMIHVMIEPWRPYNQLG